MGKVFRPLRYDDLSDMKSLRNRNYFQASSDFIGMRRGFNSLATFPRWPRKRPVHLAMEWRASPFYGISSGKTYPRNLLPLKPVLQLGGKFPFLGKFQCSDGNQKEIEFRRKKKEILVEYMEFQGNSKIHSKKEKNKVSSCFL